MTLPGSTRALLATPPTMSPPPAPLPAPANPLLGRDREVADLRERLLRPGVRLLTLTGAPGVGKTRLAIEAAGGLATSFRDGVLFVPLAPVESAARAPAAILEALALRPEGDRPPTAVLRDFLRARDCLLLLDNLEHIPEIGLLVADLLASAPQLRVLATSRTPLHLSAEHEVEIPPLPVPGSAEEPAGELAGNPSVALFAARARAVAPGFEPAGENAAVVAELCRRLEGIPLAIELAAARTKFLGARGLLERLGDRLGTLRGGARDLPERQRTLEAAIAWSHDLLPAPERRLFAALSVFVGGWGLEAAGAVCGDEPGADPVEALEALVDHSLVHRATAPDGTARFGMLETLREYARARLEEEGPDRVREAGRRHALHFLDLARRAAPALRGARAAEALARLDPDRDNLRAAVAWSLDAGDAGVALGLCAALPDYWRMRGLLTDGRAWTDRALRLRGGADGDRARCLAGAGMLARLQGDLPAARDGLEAAARLAGEVGARRTRAEALTELGITCAALGEMDAAESQLAEAWRIQQEEGDAWGRLSALHARAKLALAREDAEGARALRSEAVELARATGDAEWEARALVGLGEIARQRGEHLEARDHLDQALALYREIRNPVHTALALRKLAHVALHLGDLRGAREALLESLRAFRRVDQRGGVAACAVGLGCLRSAEGDDAGAVRLLAASGLLGADETGVLQPADVADRDAALARSRARLGEEAFKEAVGQGRVTPLDQLLAAVEMSALPAPAARAASGQLTARELDVLRLLTQGLSYAEMGRKLFISPRTVDAHLRAIYSKLSVRSRHEAALYAQRHGLA